MDVLNRGNRVVYLGNTASYSRCSHLRSFFIPGFIQMPAGLIFITGATGFIGSAVALEALNAGYSLRISIRKESQIPKLKKILSQFEDKIEFVVVPDITQESSFAGKLEGVEYVLHLASPLPHGTNKETYFGPAVKGTTAILKEAAKVSTVKRVVITSSMAALIPLTGVPEGEFVREDTGWDLSVDPNADFTGPDDAATSFRLYRASKLLANNASWEFRNTAKPHFALVTLHPAYVFGHNHVQTSPEEVQGGTNGMLWGTIMTGKPMGNSTGVHVRDVAEAHIKALDETVPDGSKFLLAGKRASWSDVARIVKRDYPDIGAKITEDISGEPFPLDTTEAEKVLGMKWRSLDQMVKDVVDQQLELMRQTSL
ncbi:putative 3-beta hydroxysteroid dehydrogenase/isomerase [Aspergillus fumigatus Af293]